MRCQKGESMSGHISDQIVVYKNDKVLVELRDKLKVASVANYAHIHATGEQTGNGTKRTSLIGILMKDYSKGTKDQAVTVTANVSPEEIRFLFSRLNAGFPAVDFKQEKIFGDPDNTGHSQVTKLRIIRAEKDSRGNQRNNPWYIEIENGKGIAVKNSKGGTYMKSNSFSGNGKASANLNDLEMFRLLCKTVVYSDACEKVIGPSLIIHAENIIKKNPEHAQRHNTSAA